MRLVDLVKIDHRFEKSVNLLLDLNDKSKLKLYIPTRSSVKLLVEYLKEVDGFSGKRANILIGPYGKGKSHLLLVLMSILSGTASEELDELISRIAMMDEDAVVEINKVYKKKKLLPVIINPSSGNLSQAFVRSLSQTLKRENLLDVVPDNYFSEALHTIEQWKQFYQNTYKMFQEEFGSRTKDLLNGLKAFNYTALEEFRTVYPKLTSGSAFNPIIDDDVLSVYRSVNRVLCEKYGYDGIYIIFDEFSKYVEGHTEEGFSSDMKTLQDMCELCNASKDEQLHLTCVAHKAIRAYGDSLSKEVKNAFQGVEGRLNEIQFIVSSQNNYELIADAIQKKPAFEKWKVENKEYQAMLEASYQIKELTALFDKGDFEEIVVKGAFPLTPLTALLLLGLSEKIAQNERTIFTFLTGKDLYSLAMYVEKCRDTEFVGAPLIYDYFSQLLSEEKDLSVHNEWLKAEYALEKIVDDNQKKVVKTLAVIRMINREDTIPANDEFLKIAVGIESGIYDKAIEELKASKLVEYKPGQKVYDFKNGIGIDIENAVSDCVARNFSKINVSDVINKINAQKYILPKKYNQDYFMTRYIKVHAITSESFLALSSTSYLPQENEPDGYLFVIIDGKNVDKSKIEQHVVEMEDPTVAVAIAELSSDFKEKAQQLLGIMKLSSDKNFMDENVAVTAELENWKNILVDELNGKLQKTLGNISEIYTMTSCEQIGARGLNRTMSEWMEQVYFKTPIINHELVNRHQVSVQIAKARNLIVDDIFHSRSLDKYENGTSAESTIYRACMIHTEDDENLENIRREIMEFIRDCKGKKGCFATLVNALKQPPIGMRKGVMPIFIAEQIMRLEDMPVIYHDKTEIAMDAKLISDIIAMPEKHYLYVETETGEKLEYIEGLESLFAEYGEYCREIESMNRLAKLKCFIQAWYRSLPQTATTFRMEDYEGQNVKELVSFRKLLIGEPNSRDLIFEQMPKAFKAKNLRDALNRIKKAKNEIDEHIKVLKDKAERLVRESLCLSEKDNFRLSLQQWYENLADKTKSSLLPVDSQNLLNCIRDIANGNGTDIIENLSKATTNFFVEDWTDKTILEFKESFEKLIEELEKKKNVVETSGSKITITAGDGTKECFYDFDSEDLSSSGYFFQSALDDIMEEYGSAVDNNEKIGILMNMVKKLMG